MKRARWIVCGWLIFCGVATLAFPVAAQNLRSDSKVKATAVLASADAGYQVLRLELVIEAGWHLYANPPGSPSLERNKTVLEIATANGKLTDVEITYPKGIEKPEGDEIHRHYVGKTVLQARFKRAAEPTPLEAHVHVSACHGATQRCLLPATVKVKLP